MFIVLAMQIEKEFGGPDAKQRGSHHIGEPVRVMAHPAESVEHRKRVNRPGDVPPIVVILAYTAARANIGVTSPDRNDCPP